MVSEVLKKERKRIWGNSDMAEFTKEMYDDLKKNGYINDEPYINKMLHEIGKELSDRLSQKTEIIELNYEIQRKINLGEIQK